jgi:hypothetical protein
MTTVMTALKSNPHMVSVTTMALNGSGFMDSTSKRKSILILKMLEETDSLDFSSNTIITSTTMNGVLFPK